ncbi:MAG: VWA domain-containing protein [Mogibacterium sp.]|nr:VWA domain-containing protein [Mogibacterium sp.]
MSRNLTEMVFILDKSGSMYGMTEDTIGGFNAMIAKQKAEEGEALVSTVLFCDESIVLHDRVPVEKVPEMTEADYRASGCTALLDALGDAIHHIRNVHKYIREEDRPDKTIFVITTDGLENASRRYDYDAVQKLIGRQKECGWEFLFLAANINAVETAASVGIGPDRAVDFHNDSIGVRKNYACVSDTISSYRACGEVEESWSAEIKKDFKSRRRR